MVTITIKERSVAFTKKQNDTVDSERVIRAPSANLQQVAPFKTGDRMHVNYFTTRKVTLSHCVIKEKEGNGALRVSSPGR